MSDNEEELISALQAQTNKVLICLAAEVPINELLTNDDCYVRNFAKGLLTVAKRMGVDPPTSFASFIEELVKEYPGTSYDPTTMRVTTTSRNQIVMFGLDGNSIGNLRAINKVKIKK